MAAATAQSAAAPEAAAAAPKTLGDFATMLKFPEALLNPLMVALGAEKDTELEFLADIPQKTVDATLTGLKRAGEALTPVEKGRVNNFFKKLRGPTEAAPVEKPAVEAKPEPIETVKKKMSVVLDQADEGVFEELTISERQAMRKVHRDATGDDPMESERPSSDQLASLKTKMAAGSSPYVDFALWGPFGKRLAKLRKFDAQIFVDNELKTKTLQGPSDFEAWMISWRVFRAAMIMLEAASPAVLDRYAAGIREMNTVYEGHWGLIWMADEKTRYERWETLLEQLQDGTAEERAARGFLRNDHGIRSSRTRPTAHSTHRHIGGRCMSRHRP